MYLGVVCTLLYWSIIAALHASSPKESKALLDFLDFFFAGTSLTLLPSFPSSELTATFLFPRGVFVRLSDEENDRLDPVALTLLVAALPGEPWSA